MRLIDADAFVQFLKDTVVRQKYENLKIDGLLTVADVIDAVICDLDGTSLDGFKNSPTIEPERKKGRWINDHCSECGQYVWYGDMRKFCPKCGAIMEDEERWK